MPLPPLLRDCRQHLDSEEGTRVVADLLIEQGYDEVARRLLGIKAWKPRPRLAWAKAWGLMRSLLRARWPLGMRELVRWAWPRLVAAYRASPQGLNQVRTAGLEFVLVWAADRIDRDGVWGPNPQDLLDSARQREAEVRASIRAHWVSSGGIEDSPARAAIRFGEALAHHDLAVASGQGEVARFDLARRIVWDALEAGPHAGMLLDLCAVVLAAEGAD